MKKFQRIVGVVAVLCLVLGVVRLWFTPSALAVTTTPPEIVITETDPASPNPMGVNDTFEGALTVDPTDSEGHKEDFPGDTEITWAVVSVTKDGTEDNSLISQINPGGDSQTASYSGSFTEGGVYEIQFQATASNPDWSDDAVSPTFTVTVKVVEVASLTPDPTGTESNGTNVYGVADNTTITVTATSNPSITDASQLPSSWSFFEEEVNLDLGQVLSTEIDQSQPGITTIIASCGTSAKTNILMVVGVDSLEPDPTGTDLGGGTNVYCVASNQMITVTATPAPSSATNQLPDGWSFIVNEKNLGKVVSSQIDQSQMGITTVIASCGDSAKTNVVVVAKPILEIYLPAVVDVSETMIPEADKLTKGSVTFVNLDNDDEDGKFDDVDDEVSGGDNELVKIKLSIGPNILNSGTIQLTAPTGADNIRVWKQNDAATSSEYTLGDALTVSDDFTVEGDYLVKEMWVEGIKAHTTQQGTTLRMTYDDGTGTQICQDDVALTVIGVEKVEWVGRNNSVNNDNNLDTDDPNWKAAGLDQANNRRVFPDARMEGTTVGAARDKVDVKVTLSCPPPQPIKMYLKSFDVDDPSSDAAPVDDETKDWDNRGAVDGNKAGKFTGEDANHIKELVFDASTTVKEQSAEFTVTMQPGDNFRVVANGDKNFVQDLENDDAVLGLHGSTTAEKNADKQRIVNAYVRAMSDSEDPADWEVREADKYCSPTLTVWRFLHVEVDSMGPVVGNTVNGNITGITGVKATGATSVTIDVNLTKLPTGADASLNLDSNPARNGRFENGWMRIGQNGAMTPSLLGNGTTRLETKTGKHFLIPFTLNKGANSVSGQIVSMKRNAGFSSFGVDIDLPIGIYNGGTLSVAGRTFNVLINGRVGMQVSDPSASLPFELHDDDRDYVLPRNPDTSDLERAFKPAYVKPMFVLPNPKPIAPFVLNLTSQDLDGPIRRAAYQFDNAAYNINPSFWTVYLLGSFQGSETEDHDPNTESATFGIVDDFHGQGAVIYLEVLREKAPTPFFSEKLTVSHEVGHLFNGYHGDGGLMVQSGQRNSIDFFPKTLNKIRGIPHP